MELTPKELAHFESIARGLQADGYNGPVVARKMISEHGMEEAAAVALVSRLYGKSVDPRRGDATAAVLGGLLFAGTTGTIAALAFYFLGFSRPGYYITVPFAGMAVSGLVRAFIASMNAGVKNDLREPDKLE